jgi:hypothetical protein
LLLISLLQHPAIAQHITGDLQFSVFDSLGQPVPGVNAIITGPNVQGVRGAVSDNLGHCVVLALSPGKISVRLSHTAYRPVIVDDVLIQLGKTTSLGEIRLHQRTHDLPELVISGQRPNIDPRSTTYGSNLRPSDFENLPVDRNYRGMVSLLPQANASYFGDEVNIAGATGFENKYVVDGTEVTDPLIGGSGTNLPYNFIQEVEVKAGGYEAESRSSLGGLLNVVTYSGTNEIHGSAFGFYTSNRFASQRRIGLSDPTQGGFSDYDVGFGIGGPIILDELWFYLAYNPTFARRDVDVPGFGISVDRTIMHSFATKLTWGPSSNLRFTFTTTGDPTNRKAVGRNVGVPPASLTSPDPYLQNIREGGINVSLDGTYTLGDNLLFEASLARVDRHDTGEPSTETGNTEVFFNDHTTDVWSGGPSSRWDSFRHSTMARLGGTILAGSNTVKAGIEYKVNSVNNQYTVHSIDKYGDTTYFEFLGKGFEEVQHRIPSVFLQDVWQVTRDLNVHAGIRWDGQYVIGSNGEVVQKVTVPLQPRLGFAYVLDTEASQKIFGSYGRFAQEFGLFQSVNYHSDQGYFYGILYNHDPRVSSTGGDTIFGDRQTISPEVQGLRGQFFDEFSLGYERAVGENLRLSVQGLYRALREVIDEVYLPSEDRNHIGNPGRGILSDWPAPQRNYTALILTIERHQDARFNFLVSYVLSRDYGNYDGLFDAIYHSEFPNGSSAFYDAASAKQNTTGLVQGDRTHVFKLSGSYRILPELSAGISFIAQSGTPLSEFEYLYRGIRFLSPRGSAGRTPAIWDLSARVLYEPPFDDLWRARFILDVFHIASQRKPVDVDKSHGYLDSYGNFYANSTYGQAYRYQPPMSVRLGMEVNF